MCIPIDCVHAPPEADGERNLVSFNCLHARSKAHSCSRRHGFGACFLTFVASQSVVLLIVLERKSDIAGACDAGLQQEPQPRGPAFPEPLPLVDVASQNTIQSSSAGACVHRVGTKVSGVILVKFPPWTYNSMDHQNNNHETKTS